MDDDALSNLLSFTGTTRYYQFTRRHLLTDGTKYLADTAGAYWLMDAAASHLDEIGTQDWFVLIRLEVQNCSAFMVSLQTVCLMVGAYCCKIESFVNKAFWLRNLHH